MIRNSYFASNSSHYPNKSATIYPYMTNPAITTFQQEFQKAIEHLKAKSFSAADRLRQRIVCRAHYGRSVWPDGNEGCREHFHSGCALHGHSAPRDKSVLARLKRPSNRQISAAIGKRRCRDPSHFPLMTEERRLHLKSGEPACRADENQNPSVAPEGHGTFGGGCRRRKARAEKDLQEACRRCQCPVEELAKEGGRSDDGLGRTKIKEPNTKQIRVSNFQIRT